jgi:hypothetical protein
MPRLKKPAVCLAAYAFWLVLVTNGAPARAAAQDQSDKRLVFLAVRQDEQTQERALDLASAIQDQVADLGFSIAMGWVDGFAKDVPLQNEHAKNTIRNTGVLGALWLIETDDGLVFHLIAANESGQWSLVRQIEPDTQMATAETLGIIVRASLTAFLDGKSEPEFKPPTTDTRRSPDKTDHTPTLSGAAGYAIVVTSDDLAPMQGLGVRVMLSLTPALQAFAGYTALFPVSMTHDLATLELTHHPADMGLKIGSMWSCVELAGALSVTINYVSSSIDPAATTLKANEDSGNIQISLAPELWLTVWVLGRLGVYASIGADILVSRPRYIIQLAEEEQLIHRPWPFAPRGFVGLTLALF